MHAGRNGWNGEMKYPRYISWARVTQPETMDARYNMACHAFSDPFRFSITIGLSPAEYKSCIKRRGKAFEVWVDIFGFGFMFWVII